MSNATMVFSQNTNLNEFLFEKERKCLNTKNKTKKQELSAILLNLKGIVALAIFLLLLVNRQCIVGLSQKHFCVGLRNIQQ